VRKILRRKSPQPHSHSFGTALSDHVLSLSHASQSDLVVGSSPIPFTFQMPKPSINKLHRIYTSFTPIKRPDVPGVSKGANVRCRPRTAITGVLNNVKTMKTEKIWRLLPVMYMPASRSAIVRSYIPYGDDAPIAFIGSCFAGPNATSHAFLIFSVSISSEVGACRAVFDDSARSFFVMDAV
jgi:hypothetical protein